MQTGAQNSQCKRGWMGSTIGRKQLIALTGLGLSLFVLIHMLGNMLILVGPQAYNEYSHKLTSNPLIYLAEAGLVVMFLAHMGLALGLQLQNWAARGSTYAVRSNGAKGTSLIQRMLWAQGLLILVFVVLHLISFKYGAEYSANYGQGEIRDLFRLVIELFRQPLYVGWYVFSLVILGLHLSHGVGSTLQTLGLHHPRYQCAVKVMSIGYAAVVAAGFVIQPLYVYFIYQG